MVGDNTSELKSILGRKLHKTHDHLSRLRDIEMRKIHLTPIRMGVLSVLIESSKPVTITLIASKIARESHTVTELLKRMEKDGLIMKIRQKRAPAIYTINATEKGKQAYQKGIKVDIAKKIMSLLSPDEQNNLGIYLEKLRIGLLEELRKRINIPLE
ncbi:MarR family winged helix-turn-helix transcriptional regulator [Chloroflexota bacterium]